MRVWPKESRSAGSVSGNLNPTTTTKELAMKKLIFTLLTLCLFAAGALAQSNTGTLTGTVSDPSGVVQGATVVIRDDKTGAEKTVVTNDAGGVSGAPKDGWPHKGKNNLPPPTTFPP